MSIGPFLGWVTAANAVSLTSEAVRIGVVNARGIGEALVGSALLFGGLLAAAIIRAGRTGPPQGYATFAATVLWALAAMIVAQYEGSPLTTGAAAVAALPVLLFVLREPRGGRARPGTRGTARSRAI